MSSAGHQELIEFRKKIAGFEAVKCGMKHERIAREDDSIQPLYNSAADHGLQRCEYCSSAIRRTRVACAHTLTRQILRDAIATLESRTGQQGQGNGQKDQLRALDDRVVSLDQSIIELDMCRSDEELNHAQKSDVICQQRKAGRDCVDLEDELIQIDQKISALQTQHDEFVDQAAELKDDILFCLDQALSPSGAV